MSGLFIFIVSLVICFVTIGFVVIYLLNDRELFAFIALMLGLLSAFLVVLYAKSSDRDDCIRKYGNSTITKEELVTTTSDGCAIKKVVVSSCSTGGQVYYITNCDQITWTEKQGKYSVQKTSVTRRGE